MKELIKVSKAKWDKIPKDYKGLWERWIKDNGWQPDLPEEFIGKRTVFEGCIVDYPSCNLLTEGIHFEIVD